MVEKHFKSKLKVIRFDNAKKLEKNKAASYFLKVQKELFTIPHMLLPYNRTR